MGKKAVPHPWLQKLLQLRPGLTPGRGRPRSWGQGVPRALPAAAYYAAAVLGTYGVPLGPPAQLWK